MPPAKRSTTRRPANPARSSKRPTARRTTPTSLAVSPATPPRVTFTHVEKVWFPEADITKGDVLQYYLSVADKLLPHLRDRPMTIERLPDGVGEGKPRFWQKNTPDYYPTWIPRIELPTETGKPVHYALVNDVDTLAYFVNQGVLTFHPFLSRVEDLDRPDYVLFDLDPGGAPFSAVIKIARTIRDVLDEQGHPSYPKTSGKSGIHILVPWRDEGGYDEARAWAINVARAVIQTLPDLATIERLKNERDGRVYVDVIQNARGHHAVPPYVLRPTPQATVSTPLDWKEVTPRLDPKKFNIRTIDKRLKAKVDPMAALLH